MIKCPHCGKSHYSIDGGECTAMYCPTITENGKVVSNNLNQTTIHYTCLECGKHFTNKDAIDTIIDNKNYIEQARVRSELAQEVTLPIDKWKEILNDLEVLDIIKEKRVSIPILISFINKYSYDNDDNPRKMTEDDINELLYDYATEMFDSYKWIERIEYGLSKEEFKMIKEWLENDK